MRQAGWCLTVLGALSCLGPGGESSSSRAPLLNGAAGPVLATLGPTRLSAVGTLRFEGSQVCTGVWVGATRFLTAAHCVKPGQAVERFDVTSVDALGEPVLVPVVGSRVHPTEDLAVLQLGLALPAARLEPFDWPRALEAARAGESLEVAGAGFGTPTTGRGLGFGVFEVERVDGARVTLAPAPPVGVCHGDSGGPALRVDGRLVGLVSEGDPSCQGRTYLVDLSAFGEWFASLGPAPGLPSVPCQAEGASSCSGETATTCLRGWLRATRCDVLGQRCGSSPAGAVCRPRPCDGEVDERGRCDGEVARWCQDDVVRTEHCADEGRRCAETGEGARCVATPPEVRRLPPVPEQEPLAPRGCQHAAGLFPLALVLWLRRRSASSLNAVSSQPLIRNHSS